MANQGSPKFQLNKTDLKKIWKGAGIALTGAFLTYLTQITTEIEFGLYTPIVVALLSVLVNLGNKFLNNTKTK